MSYCDDRPGHPIPLLVQQGVRKGFLILDGQWAGTSGPKWAGYTSGGLSDSIMDECPCSFPVPGEYPGRSSQSQVSWTRVQLVGKTNQ